MAVLARSGSASGSGSECNVQQWITSRTSQGLFWILTLGHCSVYMLGPSSFESFTSFVLFVWFTGAPLAVMTILEVCIRVSVQAGPIWKFKSWRWMMIPLYHQLEAFVMAVMAFRGGMSIYLLLLAVLGGESPTSVQDQDKATVLVLCGYRALRTWGDLHGVSVRSTLRWRRRQARKQKVWMNEYKCQLEEHRQLFFVRMQRCFDHRLSQLTLLWATILYCFMEFQDSFPITSEIVGYILLGAFFCEFIARAKAQGGERFFRPMYNKLEFFVLIAGTWCLFYASWYTDLLAESKDERATLAAATVFLLMLHRCIRLLAIRFQVSGSQFHANTLMSAKAMEIFMAKFGNLVEVPPTNIHVDVPASIIHIEKATLKPEAFRDLHLPVTFSGGLIEDLFIDFFTQSASTGAFARVGRGQTNARTKVRIRNLLLVLSPGGGLAEAGGSHGTYWKAGNLQEGKAAVVDLILRRLSAPFPDRLRRNMSKETLTSRGSDSNPSPTWSQPRGLGRFARMQWKLRVALNSGVRRFKNLLQDSTLRHLDLDIQNASLQFEDSSGALGHGSLSMGMKMDDLKLMRDAGASMTLQLARLSSYVEPFGAEESWQKKSITQEKPQNVVRKMVRLNHSERLRSWAFAELGKGLNATERLHQLERWPERHNVLMIPWVSLHAGPQGIEEESRMEEEVTAASQSRASFGRALRERVQQVATRVTRVRISSDIEDQLFGSPHEEEDTMRWHWKLQVRPVTVMVDDVQLGCVRHLHHCIRSWLSCDAAFRWRPDLTPLDPMVTPRERRAVVRCWWYYALYRILAKRTTGMPLKFLDLAHKAGYRFKYRSLLSVVVGRSGPLIPGGGVFLKPSPQQLKQMQELQMHLAYPDIISCYRAVLANAVGQDGQGATTLRAVQEAHQEVLDAAEVQELELDSEAEDEMELESPEDTTSGTSSGHSQEPSASGTWELRWSGLEVWVPFWRPGRGYRPVFLHVNFQELAIDAEVLEKDDTDSKLAPFSLLCSLKGFTFSSPECGKANAAVTDVVKITHPVSMASSLFGSFFHLGPMDSTCIGEPFALILQARATSGKEVSAVVHCPELKVMFWEPLILTLRAFVTQSPHRFMNDNACATLSVLHGGNVTVKDGKVYARNGRIGPTSISATFETVQESEEMMKSQASEANQQTKLTQRLQAAQRLFERCVLIHEDIGIDLSFNLRPIQIFQVGQYTKDQLGIEEARIPPQYVSANALRADEAASVAFGRSRTGTLWAESGNKMCFMSAGPPCPEAHGAGGAEDYMSERHSRLTDLAESMSPSSWVAGSELLQSLQKQDESEEPGVQNAWRPFWMFCCCKNDVDQDKHSRALRVSELGIRSGPDDALGKALVHLAFWKLGPDEFSAEWIKKQEAEWHRKVSLGRGRPLSL